MVYPFGLLQFPQETKQSTFQCLVSLHYSTKRNQGNTNMKGYFFTIFVIVIMPTFVRAIFGGEDVKDPHKYPWIVKVISQYV